jgi:hypothetical protein
MTSRLLAATAALVMGSLVADAGHAEWEGQYARTQANAGSKSIGIAAKGAIVGGGGYSTGVQTLSPGGGFFAIGEISVAAQKNWSNAKAQGTGVGDAHSNAFGGSTARTDSTSDSDYGNSPEAAGLSGGGGGGGYGGGRSGTSTSSFGGSSASASVGGGGDD